MLVYLNSVPDEWGGWTTFPKLNLKMSPQARDPPGGSRDVLGDHVPFWGIT